jgi:parvulin-like peptidyl-prolyl isomerase
MMPLVSVLMLVASSGGPALADSVILAEWEGGEVTGDDYVEWWLRMPEGERPELATMDDRTEFLETVADARLMLQEASRIGLDTIPDITEWVRRRREGMVKEYLFGEAVKGRVSIDESEVEEVYRGRRTQITASHIVVPDAAQADAIIDSLESGVPFADIATRHSTCASGPRGGTLGVIRPGDFSDRWTAHAFALEPGEVSQPFEVDRGFCIIKVDTKQIVDPEDPDLERSRIRKKLLSEAALAEQESYIDSLRLAYRLEVDVGAVVDLAAKYAVALSGSGGEREVVDEVILPIMTGAEEARPLATYRGGELTAGETVRTIAALPYPVRPVLDDPDELIGFINRNLTDTLVAHEGEKRGIADMPGIRRTVEKVRQKRTLELFFRSLTLAREIPEEDLKSFFAEHRDDFTMQAGHTASKIVVQSKATADSLYALLQAGEDFEDLARRVSIDPFTAPKGGRMGFKAVGSDEEFDGFYKQLEPGGMGVFRSVEGFVVVRLDSRQEAKSPTFEEARDAVIRALRPSYRDMWLKEWLAERRIEADLKTYPERLAQVELAP